MAATDRVAGHHRDHRLGRAPDLHLEIQDVEPPDPERVLVAVVAPDALVAAGAEGQVSGAGEDDHADLGVVPRDSERLAQLEERGRPKRVPHLGAVDRDPGDPVHRVVQDVLVVAAPNPTFQVITP